jgi:hypothetical protein
MLFGEGFQSNGGVGLLSKYISMVSPDRHNEMMQITLRLAVLE